MCNGLLGRKIGMTGLFSSDGRHVPVTVLEVGPCVATQIKTKEKDGYDAVQVGFDLRKPSRVSKPLAGHLKKSGGLFGLLREFGVENSGDHQVGQTLTSELFYVGERVDVSGTTKGRGFAGVVKRYGFSGGKETHGCMCRRRPGP